MSKLKFLFILCLLASPICAHADETLTITTYYPSPYGSYNTLYVYNSLGIGTTAPGAQLDIFKYTAAYNTGPILKLTRDYSNSGYGSAIFDGWNNNTDNLFFGVKANGDPTNVSNIAMTIQSGGNVGIGTTGPVAKLDLVANNSDDTAIRMRQSNATSLYFTWKVDHLLNGAATLYGYDGTTEVGGFTQTRSGGVGIGTTNPSYKLQLSTDSAAKPGTNTWTIASDRRLKKDIRPYTNGLSIIKRINPVWFKYNGKAGFPQDNQEHIGVIGQEIIKVAPYTVNTFKARLNPADKKETKLLNFNSHALVFDLINAVKEQQTQIESLKEEIKKLKSRK